MAFSDAVPKTIKQGTLGGRSLSARQGRIGSNWTVLVLFLPPALLLFTLFVVIPILQAGWYSFFDWNGYGRPDHFVGMRNYLLLLKQHAFRTALTNNVLIIVVSLVVQLPLALWLATLLAQRIRGAVAFRMIFFLPYVLAEIAAGMIWRFVYDGDYGLVASLAHGLGFQSVYLLADRNLAMYAIIVVIVWKYFGFHMMLYIAGLQSIDRSYYEAAEIDGATRGQMFRRITLPLLKPTIVLTVFFSVIGSMQLFDLIMPMTRGGPSDSTQTMVTYLYSYGITRMRIGFGSAVGVTLFLICVIFAFGYKKAFMRNE
ncbi:carbohydrate ABC transporter membrane protein 1, CUT1 family [Faunimonas pinastri]|uniref:Carbohydrate ABC transporter membrane protein 1, CUT1 family n=1 Tax=Faunimonas pinastri TaxID=1855383 RepID=A0A1H9NI01_9HYPH|nr:sugar ABC transporter permease [Faunimonas pinastri]SER35289.1 carbohydrate ABC transporter membrane protein 1, CUT1 family [Faunimonas pinastri]